MPLSQSIRPVVLEPRHVERVWGDTRLHPWYSDPTHGNPIGEVWLTAEECRVTGGEFDGKTLNAMSIRFPDRFANEDGYGFPLLVKMLFPREWLSVQVHPDDNLARAAHHQWRGKTECWYIVSAQPGAEVAVGPARPMDRGELQDAVRDGSIANQLRRIRVRAGDTVFVDAGTVHAIGPGMVVLEIQQYSDLTYRLWDYGRGRELHIDQGIRAVRAETAAELLPPLLTGAFDRLVSCSYFTVDRFNGVPGKPLPVGDRGKLQILIALCDGVKVESGSGGPVVCRKGYATMLPAGAEAATLQFAQRGEVIRVLAP